jgi:hypothetical protein
MPLGPSQKETEQDMKAKAVAAGMEHREQEMAESTTTQPQLASTLRLDEIQQRA